MASSVPERNDRECLPAVESELSRLAAAMSDGTATVADRDRLETLLQDSKARRAYSLLMHLHGELLWHYRDRSQPSDGQQEPSPPTNWQPVRQAAPPRDGGWKAACTEVGTRLHRLFGAAGHGLLRPAAVAVAAAAAMAGGAFVYASVMPQPKKLETQQSGGPVVANIAGIDGAVWREAGASMPLSFGIAPDTHLDLAKGLVELQFRNGASVVVQGPTSLLVCDGNAVNIYEGRVTVRSVVDASAGESATPAVGLQSTAFVVNTPYGTTRTTGAEYGVAVTPASGMRVEVFSGNVEVTSSPQDRQGIQRTAVDGESFVIGPKGGVVTDTATEGAAFIRALPGRSRGTPGYGWAEQTSRIIYRDGFDGTGALTARLIGPQNGGGQQSWLAPRDGWRLENGRLEASENGLALLPFSPEPGCVYRLAVTMNATAADGGAAAIGFLSSDDDLPRLAREGYLSFLKNGAAWTGQRGQRHEERGDNFACAGPGTSNRIGNIDDRYGRRTRMVQLDTRGRRWIARFFVDGLEMAWFVYDHEPRIGYVGLATDLAVSATFEDFSLAVSRP